MLGHVNYERITPPARTQSQDLYENELDAVHETITHRPGSRRSQSRPSLREQTVSKDKLKSIEMDILDDKNESWCSKHGLQLPELRAVDKRSLRQFFLTLDDDGSGEVSFNELLDPLVSSGMYRSSQDVIRLLSALDKNNSSGIDFDELLIAVTKHSFGDKSKLKTLVQCTSDPHGFSMDTLLSAERRKMLIAHVTERASTRNMTEDERLLADLICNENVSALEVLVKKQKKKNVAHGTAGEARIGLPPRHTAAW